MAKGTRPNRRRWRLMNRTSLVGLMLMVLVYLMPAPTTSGEITYRSDWTWDKSVMMTEDGWQVMNDLGYTIHVTSGYVVSYSVTMNACAHSHNLFGWLIDLITPATAHAGHSTEDDPAQVEPVIIESLTDLQSYELGTVTVNEPGYCEGHYLVARATSTAMNMLDEIDMMGRSLVITGTYMAPETDEIVPFTVQTSLAWGTIKSLMLPDDDTAVHVAIGSHPVEIVVERHLDTLFDGVDFANMNETERDRTILRSLTENTTLWVTAGNTHQ